MKARSCWIVLLAVLCRMSVAAQELDSSPVGVMISHGHPKGGWMLNYAYMNVMMKGNLSGTSNVSDEKIWNDYIFAPQNMRMDMHMLMGMYGLTGRISMMVAASYVSNNMAVTSLPGTSIVHHHANGITETSNETSHTHSTSGFGDVKLWTLYKFLNGEGSSLVLSAGINFPTGKIKIKAGEHALFPGEHHTYMMQLGTGSFDLMPGVTYYKKYIKASWSAQLLGTIRPFNNSIGYHYGSDITANAWYAYKICSLLTASLRIEAFNGGRISGNDPMIYSMGEPDANPENYGGTRINSYAGINFYIKKSFMHDSKLGVEFGLPVYQNLYGPQLANQYMLNAGITKSF